MSMWVLGYSIDSLGLHNCEMLSFILIYTLVSRLALRPCVRTVLRLLYACVELQKGSPGDITRLDFI